MKTLVSHNTHTIIYPAPAHGPIVNKIYIVPTIFLLGCFLLLAHMTQAKSSLETYGNCDYEVCKNGLIENGSFEYCKEGWSLGSTTGYNYDTHYNMHGNYNIFIVPYPYHNDYASLSQTISANAGEEYDLSFYAGVHNAVHDQEVALQFLDASGNILDQSSVEINYDVTGTSSLKSYNLSGTAPLGTQSVRVLGSVDKAPGYTYAYLKLDAVCLTMVGGGGGSLPVEWLGFDGEKRGNDGLLTWQTAIESNASHYDIERSLDAETFEKIGELAAVGNTQDISTYSFIDKKAAKHLRGTVYYRLRQVDQDGKIAYSHLVSIAFEGTLGFEVSMNLYPNPTTEFAQISLQDGSTIRRVSVLNGIGEKMGVNQTVDRDVVSLDLSQLIPGYYFVQVLTQSGYKITKTLIVTK